MTLLPTQLPYLIGKIENKVNKNAHGWPFFLVEKLFFPNVWRPASTIVLLLVSKINSLIRIFLDVYHLSTILHVYLSPATADANENRTLPLITAALSVFDKHANSLCRYLSSFVAAPSFPVSP